MGQAEFVIAPLPGHRFSVKLSFESPAASHVFYLPVWIPGSYTRRDFSKNVFNLRFSVNGEPADWRMVSPSEWQAEAQSGGRWTAEYEVYSREYSVRGCYLDDVRAMFNPCCACMAVEGLEDWAQALVWQPDALRRDWTLHGAPHNRGRFAFSGYQHLIDSPLMMGKAVQTAQFEAGGALHEFAVTGSAGAWDFAQLIKDTAQVCQEAVKMFGRLPDAASKFYSFLLFLTEKDYGGLEHEASAMLMAPRRTLPVNSRMTAGYTQLLGLISHEYFHTWNVKSLRPSEYRQGYQLRAEQPSEMLWLFEGFTAYFDNLLLLRSGVIDLGRYQNLLEADIGRYWQRGGRHLQTLANSSFEAWTKLYNGGENAGNVSTSYYVQGSLAAWCMDMEIREKSGDTASLASVLAALWNSEHAMSEGVDEALFIKTACEQLPASAHAEFADFIARLLHSTEDLPLRRTARLCALELSQLAPVSVDDTGSFAESAQRAATEPGMRWREEGGRFFVRITDSGSPAMIAGLAAGDEIVSVNGMRATGDNLWQQLCKNTAGETVRMSVLRDGITHFYHWPLERETRNTCQMCVDYDAGSRELARLRRWTNQAID